jgi:hypothetical protein
MSLLVERETVGAEKNTWNFAVARFFSAAVPVASRSGCVLKTATTVRTAVLQK